MLNQFTLIGIITKKTKDGIVISAESFEKGKKVVRELPVRVSEEALYKLEENNYIAVKGEIINEKDVVVLKGDRIIYLPPITREQ